MMINEISLSESYPEQTLDGATSVQCESPGIRCVSHRSRPGSSDRFNAFRGVDRFFVGSKCFSGR